VDKFLAKGLIVFVAASLTYVVLKFIDLLMRYWRHHAAREEYRGVR